MAQTGGKGAREAVFHVQIMGRGTERVRPPRHVLEGARRAEVTRLVEAAAAQRPTLGAAA